MAGVTTVGETPSLTQEFGGKWGYSPASQPYCSLSDPSPTYSATIQAHELPHPGEYLKLRPLLQKYGPNERTDESSRENTTKRQRDGQPIRCTVQNTGNQDAHRND